MINNNNKMKKNNDIISSASDVTSPFHYTIAEISRDSTYITLC